MSRSDLVKIMKECPFGDKCDPACPMRELREREDRYSAYRDLIRMSNEQVASLEIAHRIRKRQELE